MVEPTGSCTTCGDALASGNAFCTTCGTPVVDPPPAAPAPPPASAPPAGRETVADWGGPRRGGATPPPADTAPPAGTPPPAAPDEGTGPAGPAAGDTVALWPAPGGAAAPPSGVSADPGGGDTVAVWPPAGAGAATGTDLPPAGPPSGPAPGAAWPPPAPPPAPSGGERRGRGWIVALAVVVVVLIVGAGVLLAVGLGGDDDSATSSASTEAGGGASASTAPETTAPVTATTGTSPALRQARLDAGIAVLRNEPSPDGAKIRSVRDAEGTDVSVLEELDENDGWYRVRLGDNEGYLFGALLVPPSPGHCVGRSLGKPEVLDADGEQIRAGLSGSRVLMTATAPSDGSWPVLLPGGEEGFVAESGVQLTACG